MLSLETRGNSRHQGDVGLAIAIAWFHKHGYLPAIPLTDSQDYDLIVDDDHNLYKVQVRTTYYKTPHGIYQVNLQVSGGNRSGTGKVKPFDPARVDYLFVVTNNEDLYLFPSADIKARRALNLGEKYVQYKVEW